MRPDHEASIHRAARIIARSERLIAFTGAGVSAESGVPTFRGEGGLWGKIDPSALEIGRFRRDPAGCWEVIRELFYSSGGGRERPKPNAAHRVLARWEAEGLLAFLVTQNIDGLHAEAGSHNVAEFHGSVRELVCTRCGGRVSAGAESLAAGLLEILPPRCARCGGILKPDFVFFGEAIPEEAYRRSFAAAAAADVCLVIGSTGVVQPAAEIPLVVKRSGGSVIEVDPGKTEYSAAVSNVHIRLGAGEALTALDERLKELRPRAP